MLDSCSNLRQPTVLNRRQAVRDVEGVCAGRRRSAPVSVYCAGFRTLRNARGLAPWRCREEPALSAFRQGYPPCQVCRTAEPLLSPGHPLSFGHPYRPIPIDRLPLSTLGLSALGCPYRWAVLIALGKRDPLPQPRQASSIGATSPRAKDTLTQRSSAKPRRYGALRRPPIWCTQAKASPTRCRRARTSPARRRWAKAEPIRHWRARITPIRRLWARITWIRTTWAKG